MSGILDSDPKIRNFQTLVLKNAISYRMSPPYVFSFAADQTNTPYSSNRLFERMLSSI